MKANQYREDQYISEIQMDEIYSGLDEFDLRDLCNLLNEPRKTVYSCVSKGQLKTLCLQLVSENMALKKLLNNK